MCACLQGDGTPYSSSSTIRLHGDAVLAANSIANALLALNSAANFAIYCLVGKKFRRILRRRVFRCGKSAAADDTTIPPVPESVAPTPAALDGSYGGSQLAATTTETAFRSTDIDGESNCRKASTFLDGSRVVVVVVSAADAAETACSSPTTPSADEELTTERRFGMTLNDLENLHCNSQGRSRSFEVVVESFGHLENYSVPGDVRHRYGNPADEELTALPVDTDHVKHDLELHNDLDLDLAAVVHNNDDDDDDGGGQRQSDRLDFGGDAL